MTHTTRPAIGFWCYKLGYSDHNPDEFCRVPAARDDCVIRQHRLSSHLRAPGSRICNVCSALLCLLATTPALADDDMSVPFPFGLRVRHTTPNAATAYEASAAVGVESAAEGKTLAADMLAAIGSDGSRTTGTFAYAFDYGWVLGSDEPSSGLALRIGVDLLYDSVGRLRASHLSLPVSQVGYVLGRDTFQLDVGAQAAPILAGRLRSLDAGRALGLGASAGGYLGVLLPYFSLRASANHLLASTSEGGGADWARGLVCVSAVWVDLCADGFATRFAEAPSAKWVHANYVGATLGVNLVRASSHLAYTPPYL